MESKVIFRDYQEQQAQDHNDLQTFTERTFDHLVLDAVTSERRYAGFQVTKTGQTEVQISPGRMYDVLGVIYALNSTTTQSMVSYLAAAFKRYVLLTAVGTDVETDIEERDYLIDVTTGATEPRAVATTRSRTAVLAFTSGTESGDPIRPAVPVSHVAIAYILLDTTQVVSIEPVESNKVTSTDSLDLRTDALELFAALIGPRVSALASDLADLAARVAALEKLSGATNIRAVAMDVARLKASLKYPVTASDYGTDWFLETSQSNITNDLLIGYDAKIEEGCRFGDANADEFEIALFSANDPNASYSNGLLLPKYYEILRLATDTTDLPASTLGMAQFGFQTVEMKVGYMSRSRLRYGGSYYACSNSSQWDQSDIWGSIYRSNNNTYNPVSGLFPELPDVVSVKMTTEGQTWYAPYNMAVEINRYDNWWYDTWKEPYIYAVTVDHTIQGALIAQGFLVSNDIWATQIRIFVTAKGGNEDIHMTITNMIAGVPDPDRAVVHVSYPHASIVVGWNVIRIPPTFLSKGGRYAVVLMSNANHTVGMCSGQKYLDGTFYSSTDGIFFLGDLTKDLMLQVWGCKFYNSQVHIEFTALNLDGGFRHVDILAAMWVPASCNLYWETRPNGTGEWQALTPDNVDIFGAATPPPLAHFRGRFDGTTDMHAAIQLTGSRVHLSRPKTTFKHVSLPLTLGTNCVEVIVEVTLEAYQEDASHIPHTHDMVMRTGPTLTVVELPDVTTTKLVDLSRRAWKRTYTFNVSPAVNRVCFVQTGTTNSPQMTYHVAERTFYSH
jgi:hypothetical protein